MTISTSSAGSGPNRPARRSNRPVKTCSPARSTSRRSEGNDRSQLHRHAGSAASSPYIVSPLAPVSVDRDADVLGLGMTGSSRRSRSTAHDPYVVKARVPILGDDTAVRLTQNLLRVAGTDYPKEIKARYLVRTPGAVGPEGTKILNAVLAKVGANPNRYDNPYDVARRWSRSSSRRGSLRPGRGRGVSDHAAIAASPSASRLVKRGYCQHYASLMTVLLREHGIPARFVQGFLPGDLDPLTGLEQIPGRQLACLGRDLFPRPRLGELRSDRRSSVGAAEAIPTGKPVSSAPRRPPARAARPAAPTTRKARTAARPAPVAEASIPGGGLAPAVHHHLAAPARDRRLAWRSSPGGAARAGRPPRRASTRASHGWRRGSGSGRGRRRRRTSTRPRWATCCRTSGRSSRPSPRRRSRLRTGGERSGTTGSGAVRRPTAGCGSSLLRLLFRRRERPRRRGSERDPVCDSPLHRARCARVPPPASWAASSSSGARCSVRFIARTSGRPAAELDDADAAQVERPHPEAVERQVEQRQEEDLEHAVVADDDRPWPIRTAARGSRRPGGLAGAGARSAPAAASRPRMRLSAGRRRGLRPPGSTRRRAPMPRAAAAATSRGFRPSAPRSRSCGGPPTRPGRSRGAPDPAAVGIDCANEASAAIAASIAVGRVGRPRKRRVDDLDRWTRRHRQGRRSRAGRASATRPRVRPGATRPPRAARPPGPGTGPRR